MTAEHGDRRILPSEALRGLGFEIRSGRKFSPDEACLAVGKVLYFKLLRVEEQILERALDIGNPNFHEMIFRQSTLERRLLDAAIGDYTGAQVEIEAEAENSGIDSANNARRLMEFSQMIRQSWKPLTELLDPVRDRLMIDNIASRQKKTLK